MSGHRTSCDRAGRSSGRESLGSRRTAGAFGWRGYAGPRRPPGKRYGLPVLIRRRRRLTPCAPGGCRGEPQAEWRHAGMVLAVEAASFGGLVLCPDMTPYGLCLTRQARKCNCRHRGSAFVVADRVGRRRWGVRVGFGAGEDWSASRNARSQVRLTCPSWTARSSTLSERETISRPVSHRDHVFSPIWRSAAISRWVRPSRWRSSARSRGASTPRWRALARSSVAAASTPK
jgi:hypothetical protein